jgi:hypothetical protein
MPDVIFSTFEIADDPFEDEMTWEQVTAPGDFLIVFVPYFELANYCKYGNESMIAIESKQADGQFFWLGAYCLPITAANAGTHNIAFGTFPNGVAGTPIAASVVLQNVNLDAYYLRAYVARARGTDPLPTLTIPRESGELTVAAAWCFPQLTITPGASQTERAAVGEASHGQLLVTTSAVDANTFSISGSSWKMAIGLSLRPVGSGGAKPVPALQTYYEKTLEIGDLFCSQQQVVYDDWDENGSESTLASDTVNEGQGVPSFYYDTTKVMEDIASWLESLGDTARAAEYRLCGKQNCDVLHGFYMEPNLYASPGYWVFTRGPKALYKRLGTAGYRTAVESLSLYPAYAGDHVSINDYNPDDQTLRELAYHVQAQMDAESLGYAQRATFTARREKMFEFLPYYFETFGWDGVINYQVSPFMALGILATTMIEDWEITRDTRTVPQIKLACDYCWENGLDQENQCLHYNLNPDFPTEGAGVTVGSADVNNLMCGTYAFAAWATGEQAQMDRADFLFQGAALNGFWTTGKAFNQLQARVHSHYFHYRNKFYAPTGSGKQLKRKLRRGR